MAPYPGLALLWALLPSPAGAAGRCDGGSMPLALPSPNGPPQVLAEGELGPAWDKILLAMGYAVDRDKSFLIDGKTLKPVSQDQYRWLVSPLDLYREKLPAGFWTGLQLQGYRLEESTCRLLDLSGRPFSNFQFKMEIARAELGGRFAAMETVKADLAGLAPDRPVPRELLDKLKAMQTAEVRLPPELRNLLDSPYPPTVGRLSGPVEQAYLSLTVVFDGERDRGSLLTAARPLVPGQRPARARLPASSEEQRLGAVIGEDLQVLFAGTPEGRAFLAGFAKGEKVQLPPLIVLQLAQRPRDANQVGALYSSGNDQVVVNHWSLRHAALAEAPPAERARLEAEFADPAKLRRYLEANPRLRRRAVGRLDYLFLHEFVHFEQDKRSPASVEQLRGNIPGSNLLSREHEAHREDCRYRLSRVAAEPRLLKVYGEGEIIRCSKMLGDYPAFRESINLKYRASYAGSEELPDVYRLQRARRDAARTLSLREMLLASWERKQDLKLQGLALGREALVGEARLVDRREREFLASLDPLRRRFLGSVPDALVAEGRPEAALALLRSGGAGSQEEGRSAARAVAALYESRKTWSDTEQKLFAYDNLRRAGESIGLGPEALGIKAEHDRLLREYIRGLLALLKTGLAYYWSGRLDQDDPMRKAAEHAEKKRPS